MPTADDITFYVPTRNNARTLDACLRSIAAQTLSPRELIVVVDVRSTDDTLAIARQHHARIVEQHDGTLGHARNLAIDAADSPWLASCDADVTLAPDWLERLAALRDDAKLAGIAGRTDEASPEPPDRWRALHMPHHWGEAPLRNPFMLVSEVIFRRDALLAVGGYRSDLNNYEDSDLCQRLRDAGYDLLYEPGAAASHHRRDSLVGVLDLRWRYAEYRQRQAFDGYAGLAGKLAVNREYAVTTLAKTLATHHEELAYVSLLLFFHHAVRDHQATLRRRVLIPPTSHGWFARQTADAALAGAAALPADLRASLARDMGAIIGATAPPAAPAHMPPALDRYVQSVRTAAEAFAAELGEDVPAILAASARFCHGECEPAEVPTLDVPPIESLQDRIDRVRIGAFLTDDMCRAWQHRWPDTRRGQIVGPATASERDAVGRVWSIHGEESASGQSAGDEVEVAVCPHLEAFARALDRLRSMMAFAARAVVCYRPLPEFVPGLDALAARELASAAVQAGWSIAQFDTLVGRTCLLLEQAKTPAGSRTTPERVPNV